MKELRDEVTDMMPKMWIFRTIGILLLILKAGFVLEMVGSTAVFWLLSFAQWLVFTLITTSILLGFRYCDMLQHTQQQLMSDTGFERR